MKKLIIFDRHLSIMLQPKCHIICHLESGILNVILDKNVTVFQPLNLLSLFRSHNDTSEVTEPSVPGIPSSTEGTEVPLAVLLYMVQKLRM